ncbi:hypothetical protein D3C84_933230 [compost metagenome]
MECSIIPNANNKRLPILDIGIKLNEFGISTICDDDVISIPQGIATKQIRPIAGGFFDAVGLPLCWFVRNMQLDSRTFAFQRCPGQAAGSHCNFS